MRGVYIFLCSSVFVLIIKLFKGYGADVRFIVYFITATIVMAGYPFFTFGVFLRAYSKQVGIAFFLESAISASKIDFEQLKSKQF